MFNYVYRQGDIMSRLPKELCELCERVIDDIVTHSTIPGVTEMIDDAVVCSECFDKARGELE